MEILMSVSVKDFSNICRICMHGTNKTSTLDSIFSRGVIQQEISSSSSSVDISTLDKVRLCCSIDIYMGDNLPQNICQNCFNNLLNAYQLRTLSKQSDTILKRILTSNTVSEDNEKIDTKLMFQSESLNKSGIHDFENNESEEDINVSNIWNINTCNDSTANDKHFEEATDNTVDETSQRNHMSGKNFSDQLFKEISSTSKLDDNNSICPICDVKLIDSNLIKHLSVQHSSMFKIGYKCYGCDKILDTRYERELHEDLYCSKMPVGTIYSCSTCGVKASNREDFDKHLWVRHRGRPPPKMYDDNEFQDAGSAKKESFICETCGQVLRSATTFNQHMMRHEGKQWLECNLCSFRTSDHRAIVVHKLRHEGRKPFQCQECSYKTDRSDYLKVHQMRHSGERPYLCPYCDYKAVNHSNLKRHKTTHTNVRDFQCKVCEKSYKSKKSLKMHIMTVHENVKMFYCKICHTKYAGEEAFNRHNEKKHPNGSNILQK